MYIKQFLTHSIRTYIPSGSAAVLNFNCANHVPKRWAGHSKWQNIKSTKEAVNRNKSLAFSRILRLMAAAIRQNGRNVDANPRLRALVEEAKKISMPKATLEKALKAGSEGVKPFWTVFSGPKGVVLGFEVEFANNGTNFLNIKLSPFTKKLRMKIEPHFSHLCTEKGVIITEPLQDIENSYEKALDDALQIGIEEVYEGDDKSLIFECSADRTDSYSDQLSKKGYNIQSASTELDFKEFVKLEEDEIVNIEKVINNIKNVHQEVLRASYNLEREH